MAITGRATRRQYWFQQNGSSVHCAPEVLALLISKFRDRVNSRTSELHWPSYNLDLKPLDFSFWSQSIAHKVRCQPITLVKLKEVVGDFAKNFNPEEARFMTT